MAYDLERFCGDLTSIVRSKGAAGISELAAKLQALLANPTFVRETFSDETPPGKRVLFHDPETNVYVQAHVQAPGKRGTPHSHGASWAIYGNARGFTDMTEWRRVNPESEDHAVLEMTDSYRLGTGQARAYGPHMIHATEHKEKAWVIRVTGCDLDTIPRFRFRVTRDRILETVSAK
jgi:predicted metal-dependent enzyme (double-stranded beta helix superfamily)